MDFHRGIGATGNQPGEEQTDRGEKEKGTIDAIKKRAVTQTGGTRRMGTV